MHREQARHESRVGRVYRLHVDRGGNDPAMACENLAAQLEGAQLGDDDVIERDILQTLKQLTPSLPRRRA